MGGLLVVNVACRLFVRVFGLVNSVDWICWLQLCNCWF